VKKSIFLHLAETVVKKIHVVRAHLEDSEMILVTMTVSATERTALEDSEMILVVMTASATERTVLEEEAESEALWKRRHRAKRQREPLWKIPHGQGPWFAQTLFARNLVFGEHQRTACLI
jgi:hypothetical protein